MKELLSRGRVAALVLPASAAAVALLVAFRGSPPKRAETKADDAASVSSAHVRAGEPWFAGATSASPPAETPVEPPPIIDSVKVDKSRVCEGEVAFVTVEAHAQIGGDGAMRTVVGTSLGKVAPVRMWLDEDGKTELPEVRVFGANGASAGRPIPHVQVDRCPDQVLAFVEASPLRNAPDQRRLRVSVRSKNAEAGAPTVRSVRWDLGDGTEVEGGGELVHEFGASPRGDVYPTYVVKAHVELESGKRVLGAATVEILDRAAYERRQGRALVVVKPLDRFPVVEKGGTTYTQRFRVENREESPITIDDVEIDTSVDGDRGEPVRTHASPTSILSSVTLAPRSAVTILMRVEPEHPAGLAYRSYALKGKAGDGRAAEGAFTVMAPLGKPSPTNTTPISPALEARVKLARKLLGKDLVTRADIATLEKDGRFAGLPPASDEAPSASRNARTQ